MSEAITPDSLELCAREYRGRFLSTARRLLHDETVAQDAVQDAMLSAARNLHRFRGDSQLTTWLERIVINSALSRRRVIRRRSEEPLEALLEQSGVRRGPRPALAMDTPCPEHALWQSEVRSLVRAAIDDLPTDYRRVVMMWHFEEADIAKIASRLHISPNAVRIRLHRARRALHDLLAARLSDSRRPQPDGTDGTPRKEARRDLIM